MISNRELLDEKDRLWSLICDTSAAIRAMQSIDTDLRRQVEAIQQELNRRFEEQRRQVELQRSAEANDAGESTS